MVRQGLIAATALAGLTASAFAETPQGAAAQLNDFLDRFPDLGPGYAVVVVTEDDILMNRVTGERRASTGAPLTTDTPIYIASQTKAYMGLLAARLDAEGVLSLDSTITDHWPDVQFPEGVDPSAYTMRDLLSHQVPIEVGMIVIMEAYVMRVDPAEYPRLIAEYAEAREPGFDYANIGYNIYGAILESVTGKSWQVWLDELMFDPMGLDQTSARTSDFSLDELAWSHIWQGDELGWHDVRPKTDGMMQSAGGLVTSTNDMAAFLQMQLRGEGPEGSGITADMVTTAQTGYAQTGQEDGRNPYELACSGYSLGWSICDFEGREVHIHGGGYTGNRTMMAFSPDMGIGIGVFSNSDNMTGWLTSRTINMYMQFLVEHEDAEMWSQRRPEIYPERIGRYLEYRQSREAENRAEERWGGWGWQPEAADLSAYVGRWSTGDALLDIEFAVRDGELHVWWGDAHYLLEPARPDLFGGQSAPFQEMEAFEFQRAEDGSISQLVWGDDTYQRVN